MTDVRHDGGTAGRGRDSWVEPGQDLDALLSRWTEQPGPFRARGRHSADEAGSAPASPPPPYLPPSGRRFRDDDAPPPEWARRAGPSRRRSAPEPPPTRSSTPGQQDSSSPRTSGGYASGRHDGGLPDSGRYDGGGRYDGPQEDRGRHGRVERAPEPSRSRPADHGWDGAAAARHDEPAREWDAPVQRGPVGGYRPGGDFRDGAGLTGGGYGVRDGRADWGREPRSGAELAGAAYTGRRATREPRAPGREPGAAGREPGAAGRDSARGTEARPGAGFRTDAAGQPRGFREDHPSGPNLGFGPMAGGSVLPPPGGPGLHQALLSGPQQPPAFDDTGAYAGWLSRGGATAAVLDPPRPTSTGNDLLTHDPAYDPYAPDGAETDADGPPRRPHRRRATGRRSRWFRIAGWVGAFVGILLVAGGGFAVYQYKKLSSNIQREDALSTNDKSIRDAAKQLDAENFLILGSDTREGENGKYGVVSGERSDTTILAHLSPNREKATMISFPRDAWVDLPSCRKKDGTMSPEGPGQFNSAYTTGGAQCTVLAVQKLTGIRINHYVQVNFVGFKSMVDAVGGVPICTTTPLRDQESGLRLNPGTTNLRGEQALSYVRARYGIGDGSDLGRIQRQQKFLAAMVRKATSKKLLVNPVGLTKFLGAATKSLTLDRQTSLGDLKTLADQLRDLDPKKVSFLTAPIANAAYTPPGFPAPPPGKGGSRVLLDDVAGRKLYDSIINDKPAPPKGSKPAGPAKPSVLTVAPDDVTVKVLNGVGLDGLARKVSGEIESAGFRTVEPTNTEKATRTVVRYAPSQAAAAQTVAAAVPGAVLQPATDVGTAVELVVGPDYTGVVTVKVGDPATAKTVAAPKPAATTSAPKPSPTVNAADASCT